ncbi:lipopolysaccharide biosynthesis protein [Spirosoma taeanense]|uniref:Lipopolysaccharide biosynthesis protein n=1 Tax=Spirosoma taeanense TaxID=2735870 RepID=A0A6M5Y3A4_9BACT|nr:Wzz/FepE/Etk N-terminal domain-containing protein [Spirosoma taeanense]QJW88299.1 lipopolysaccharide biosynthesis protein [Spirosoma taeanense]
MSVTEQNKVNSPNDGEYEIRLSEIAQWLAESRRTVVLWALGALLVGALYAFLTPNEFTTSVRIMPELKASGNAGGLGDLKSLAGLAGVNLDNVTGSTEAIRPDLYPDVVSSVPFALHMLRQPVFVAETGKSMSLQQYLVWDNERRVIGAIRTYLNSLSSAEKVPVRNMDKTQVLTMTSEQEIWAREIFNRIGAAIDKKSGIITISAEMPDPVVAGTVGRQTLDYLLHYVTDYRTGKARQQVRFLEQQVRNARRRYESAEYALSAYRDRNRSLFLNTAKIEEQRLQGDYLLAQTVYNDLSKQLEQARIKVQEEAPVFQTLNPPSVPLRKSGPKRLVIIIAFTIFGALAGLTAFFVRRIFRQKPVRFV